MAIGGEELKSSRRSVGVLFSGGLDSAALIAFLLSKGHEVWPVYVRSGLRWERAEEKAAKAYVRAIKHPSLRPIKLATLFLEDAYRNNWSEKGLTPGADSDDRAVFLPARNLLLVTKSLLFLSSRGIFDIAMATLKGNPFADARPSYFRILERVLAGGFAHPVKVFTPFRSWSKSRVIRATARYPLHLSLSCVSPSAGVHCGRCNKCAERKEAFKKAGVPDKTRYRRTPREKS